MTSRLPVRSPTVIFREMDDGGVLFCSRTEVYFGLNSVGVKIWENLPTNSDDNVASIAELLATLQSAYPEVDRETLRVDVGEFLTAMAESELVTYGDPTAA